MGGVTGRLTGGELLRGGLRRGANELRKSYVDRRLGK